MHYDGQEFTFGVEPSKPPAQNTPKPPAAAQHSFPAAPKPPATPVQDLATPAPSLAAPNALPADQQNYAEMRPLLRSVLRSATYAMRCTQRATGSTALQWSLTRFGHELVEIDLRAGPTLVTVEHTRAWGVSPDTVRAAARKNIARIHPPGINDPDNEAVFFDPDRRSYLTSAILTPGWLAALTHPGGSRPLVFVPTEDTVIVGNDDPVAGMKYFDMAEQIYAEAERPVSPEAFTVGDGRVVPFVEGGPHPLRALAVRARTHAAVRQYREQTELLARSYAEDAIEVEVPDVQAVQTPCGLASTAVWQSGRAADLPLVDYLWLIDADGSQDAVPFSAAVRVVGIAPAPGLHPCRYRVTAWPEPALLEALRWHAVPLPTGAPANHGVTLGQPARPKEENEELVAYQRLIDDHHDDPDPAQRERVARALHHLGFRLGELGRPEEAVAAYQRVIDGYQDDPAPVLREQVATALHNLGFTLGELGRPEEAVAAYQRLVDDYGDDPALREQFAEGLLNLGVTLGELGRPEEAVAAYQRFIDGYHDDPALGEHVTKTLHNLGVRLEQLGRPQEAVAAYQRLIDDYHDDPARGEQVAKALVNLGLALGRLGRPQEAVAVYQRLIDRYHDDPAAVLREQVATALYNLGLDLGELGRPEEAVAVYQRLIDGYGDDPAPVLRERVATALHNLGLYLGQLGRPEEEVATYRRLTDGYHDDPALGEQVTAALVNLGVRLEELGRPEEAVAVYQRLIDGYRDDPAPALREQVAKALHNLGATFARLGRREEAVAAFQRLIDDYRADPAPALREQVELAARVLRMRIDEDGSPD